MIESNQIMQKTDLPWVEDEVTLLRQLIPFKTFGEISYEFLRYNFFRSPKAVSRKAEKLKLKRGTSSNSATRKTVEEIVKNNPPKAYFSEDENDNIEIFIQEDIPEPVDLKEQVWQKILDIKAEYMTQYKHRLTGILPRGSATRKILAISDFHIPFDREDLIMEIAEKHKDADVVVINGDFTDMHAVSTWPKEKHVVLRKEYDIAMEYLEYFSKNFRHVVLVRGNHEERLNRYFNSNIEGCVSFLINKDVLSRLANGEVYDEDGTIMEIKKFDNVIYDMNQEPWFVKIGKTVFAHPKTFYSVEGKTGVATWQYFMQRENVDCVVCAHCFDEETEILTQEGWRTIDTIQESDSPITLDLETNKLRPSKLNGIHKYDTYKELIRFSSGFGLDICVTDQHGMLAKTRYNQENWEKLTAEELATKNRIYIPSCGQWYSTQDADISDNMLKLLAWVQTEGDIQSTERKSPYIRIAQSDDLLKGYIYEITALLTDLGLQYSRYQKYEADSTVHGQHRNFDAYSFRISALGSGTLLKYLNKDKTLKSFIFNALSLRQRKMFINELCKGDGSKCGSDRWRAFYTKSEAIRDQFQTLCTTASIRTKYKQRKDGTYSIHMSNLQKRQVTKVERIPYNGSVWCLSVDTGTLIARKNGTVFVTQNTHQVAMVVTRGKLCIEQGCLCAPLDYEKQGKLRFKPMSLGYSVIYQDKEGNCDFNKSRVFFLGTQIPTKTSIEECVLFGNEDN